MKKKLTAAAIVFALISCLAFSFAVNAKDIPNISDYEINLSETEYTYNSQVQLPDVTVTDENGAEVSEDVYTVSFSNSESVDAGEYSVTVSGVADKGLTGSVSREYVINPMQLNASSAKADIEYTYVYYNGGAYKPAVAVEALGTVLQQGTDYTVSYKNNTKSSKAEAVITGKGNYTGTITKTFKITLNAPESTTNSGRTLSSVQLKWSAVNGADGYYIYMYNKKSRVFTKYDSVNKGTTSYTVQNLNYATEYVFRIRAYYKNGNDIIEGDFGKACYAYTAIPKYDNSMKISRRAPSNYADIEYGRYKYCSGYEIAYSFDPNMKNYVHYADNAGVTSRERRITGLKTNRTYYFKIRLYVLVNGQKVYGEWGSVYNDGTLRFNGGISASKRAYSGSMSVSFDRQYCCDGYEICYTTDRAGRSGLNYKYVWGDTSTSNTLSGLASNKGYYVWVRTFQSIDGKLYYGSWSGSANTGYQYEYTYYSSNYVNNADRTTNLRVASNAIDGTVIDSGETFDFNDIVGPRTASRGYKKATVFTGKKGTAQELGGGICQVSSTVFNAALYGNLKINERHQHSQKVSYVPLGRDAAISGSSKNLRWTNNQDFPIKVYMSVSGGTIACSMYTISEEDPGNISIKVSKSGNTYTMRRYHNGSVNYTCTSTF